MNGRLLSRRDLGAWGTPVALVAAYIAGMVLLALSAMIDFRNARELDESGARVSHTIEASERLRTLSNTVFIAESAQRGFLLTGNHDYLAPYTEMRQRLAERLAEVDRVVSDTPAQRAAMARLRARTEDRFSAMQKQIDAYADGGQHGAATLIEQEGDSATAIRALVSQMLDEESRVLADRRALAASAYSGALTRALASTALVALALTAFYLLMQRYLRQRDAALRVVETNNAALEQRVLDRTTDLSSLSRHLLNVREQEKKIIARDLHDDFGSYLTAINMDVSRARDKISAANPEQAAKLERTLGLLNSAIEMKRQLISELRPSLLDNLGLGPALEQYIEEWARRTNIQSSFDYQGELRSNDDGCPIAIFRVFQEALNNVARHAKATKVAAYAYRVGDDIEFEIADNGIGMTEADRNKAGTTGLIGIRERVLAYGGRFEIANGVRGGTVMRGTMPCNVKREERTATFGMLPTSDAGGLVQAPSTL